MARSWLGRWPSCLGPCLRCHWGPLGPGVRCHPASGPPRLWRAGPSWGPDRREALLGPPGGRCGCLPRWDGGLRPLPVVLRAPLAHRCSWAAACGPRCRRLDARTVGDNVNRGQHRMTQQAAPIAADFAASGYLWDSQPPLQLGPRRLEPKWLEPKWRGTNIRTPGSQMGPITTDFDETRWDLIPPMRPRSSGGSRVKKPNFDFFPRGDLFSGDLFLRVVV